MPVTEELCKLLPVFGFLYVAVKRTDQRPALMDLVLLGAWGAAGFAINENAALGETRLQRPVFLKVSPLGGVEAIERVQAAADGRDFISGFMFNLPPVKPGGMRTSEDVWRNIPGAVSGPPASALADFCIRETFRRMDRNRHVLIGAGGVSTAQDAYAKIRLGASLVQLLTALVYQGPGVVRTITMGLAQLLARDGVKNVSDVVGVDAR